ncbi:hypothetical protein ZIOFF_004055 [Zingiber officinale]|uniref:Uncharacterized protein n=1 Tax=Zingiber officinale TaxID=94328 RepID=A0A8J5IAM2_ZINOF|nr:hypothetical protein ZIOFF_004055 [Zingiber officinale]
MMATRAARALIHAYCRRKNQCHCKRHSTSFPAMITAITGAGELGVAVERYMQQHNEVELSALGMESHSWHDRLVGRAVRARQVAWSRFTGLVQSSGPIWSNQVCQLVPSIWMSMSWLDYSDGIEILLGKTENFDELMAAAAEERELIDGEEKS